MAELSLYGLTKTHSVYPLALINTAFRDDGGLKKKQICSEREQSVRTMTVTITPIVVITDIN